MIWRGLLLSVLLLLSFSVVLFSEVILTDREFNEIRTALLESEQALEDSESQMIELNRELNGLRKEQIISAEIIKLQNQELELLLTSLTKRKSGQMIHDIKMFSLGLLTGAVAGVPAGIKIGITLN